MGGKQGRRGRREERETEPQTGKELESQIHEKKETRDINKKAERVKYQNQRPTKEKRHREKH